MKIIHEITLDLAQRGVQASVPLTQSDAGMHSLLIRLRNGSKEVKITGNLTATLWVFHTRARVMNESAPGQGGGAGLAGAGAQGCVIIYY